MKKIIFSFLLVAIHCQAFALGIDTIKVQESLTQIKFWLTPQLYQKPSEKIRQGSPLLRRHNALSGEIGIGIQQKIYKNVSISIGTSLSTVPMKYSFDFQANISSPNFSVNNYQIELIDAYYGNVYWSIPIALQTKIKLKKNNFVSLEIGAQRSTFFFSDFDNTSGATYGNIQGESAEVFQMRMNGTQVTRFTSYFAKIGLGRTGKKTNTLQASLVFNYTPEKIMKGVYQFSNLSVQSSGVLDLGANYMGIELAYSLTILKKRRF